MNLEDDLILLEEEKGSMGDEYRAWLKQGIELITHLEAMGNKDAAHALQVMLGHPQSKVKIVGVYYCLIGGKGHKAYYNAGRGIGHIYCPEHGFVASCTGKLTIKGKGSMRQFKDGEWEKMIAKSKKVGILKGGKK